MIRTTASVLRDGEHDVGSESRWWLADAVNDMASRTEAVQEREARLCHVRGGPRLVNKERSERVVPPRSTRNSIDTDTCRANRSGFVAVCADDLHGSCRPDERHLAERCALHAARCTLHAARTPGTSVGQPGRPGSKDQASFRAARFKSLCAHGTVNHIGSRAAGDGPQPYRRAFERLRGRPVVPM